MENTTFVAHLQSTEDMHTSDSIVIIPTYNERENIENILRAVFALEHFTGVSIDAPAMARRLAPLLGA